MQHYFRLISLWTVLALAGCASTPEPVAPVSKPTPPAVAEPEAPSQENGNTSHRVGEAGEQRLFRAGVFGY